MRRARGWAARGLRLLALVYLLYAAALVWAHPRVIYPFDQTDKVLAGFERRVLPAPGGPGVSVQEAGQGPVTVLYFMGNGGALHFFEGALRGHLAAGRRVVAMEYRGGGGIAGAPSETALKSDALAVADALLAEGGRLVLHGYSLGTGLALHVAAERDAAGVVLDAPYSRICGLMTAASGVPACWLPLVQKWDSLASAGRVEEPVLILHGAEDTIVPARDSAPLAAGLSGARRVVLGGVNHFTLGGNPAARAEIDRFIGGLPG